MRRKREETDMMEKYEIQKLRDLPIEEVAEQLGMEVERHKSLCPFHDDHHASFSFNAGKNICRCFVCMKEAIGTIDLVMRILNLDFPKACHWLADKNDIFLNEGKTGEGRVFRSASSSGSGSGSASRTAPSCSPPFDAYKYGHFFEHPWLNLAARRFLFEERKIDERVAAWCRLTSWTDKKGVNWLQIPYFSTEGKLIGIQNRNLDYKKGESTPRFRFPYGAKCSIYNLPIVRGMAPDEQLFITEGCSDCWAMLSAGHKAIAIPSATMLKPDDKKWLAEIGSQLKIEWHMFPDRDAPGESLFLQLKEILPQLVHHQLPPECKDFSEYYLKEKTEFINF